MFCYAMIRAGMALSVLLIGADRMSATINWRDRSFATVLGDAGTATLCTATPEARTGSRLRNSGAGSTAAAARSFVRRSGARATPGLPRTTWSTEETGSRMDGAAVRKELVPFMGGPAIDAALAKAGWRMEDLDLATLHEANLTLNASIVEAWRERGFRGRVLDAGGRSATPRAPRSRWRWPERRGVGGRPASSACSDSAGG
jgi:3-oxoacyl-[acyl-carrier-protein] synthase III